MSDYENKKFYQFHINQKDYYVFLKLNYDTNAWSVYITDYYIFPVRENEPLHLTNFNSTRNYTLAHSFFMWLIALFDPMNTNREKNLEILLIGQENFKRFVDTEDVNGVFVAFYEEVADNKKPNNIIPFDKGVMHCPQIQSLIKSEPEGYDLAYDLLSVPHDAWDIICSKDLTEAQKLLKVEDEDPISKLVNGPRQETYGHPFENFTDIGRMWGAILGIPDIDPEKIALCMMATKIARLKNSYHEDGEVDYYGYEKCLQKVIERKNTLKK